MSGRLSSIPRRVAGALFDLALSAVPADRREWVEAMRSEMAAMPGQAAIGFAAGCLLAAVCIRIADTPRTQIARWLLAAAAVAWSLLNVRLALGLADQGHAQPAQLAWLAAAIFALGAIVTAWRGLAAMIMLAIPLAVAAAVVGLFGNRVLPASPFADLYRAAAIEDFTVTTFAIVVAMILRLRQARPARGLC